VNLLSRLFSTQPATVMAAVLPPVGLAQQLMERADDLGSRRPHEAQELRDAARAFLRVVR
jgi:hypothetical protein